MKDRGYIEKAYSRGMFIDAERAELNQKWHLFISCFEIDKNNLDDKKFDDKVTIWNLGNRDSGRRGIGIKCPKLLL